MTRISTAFALFACALPLACAEPPPPPAVDGEIVARAVELAEQRAERAYIASDRQPTAGLLASAR
jgi:hypothetical protein